MSPHTTASTHAASRTAAMPLAARQVALRSDRGAGRAPRATNTLEHQARLALRLTPRDRWLIRMLHEHRVLTSTQITQTAFPSPRSANTRLLELYRWRVLDRFQPFLTVGSAPMHYVLDIAGAAILAAEDGLDPKTLGYRHERAIGIAHSLHLAHTVGVNGFFCALISIAGHSGAQPGSTGARALTAWWGEIRCQRLFGDLVRPDGYGRWREPHSTGAGGGLGEVEFFLEYDTGSENLTQLTRKLIGYHALAAATGIRTPVLIWLPSARRETAARHALAVALARLERPELVPVATSAADLTAGPVVIGGVERASTVVDSPAGARWLPLAPAPQGVGTWGRLRLAALAQVWPAALARRPATQAELDDDTEDPVEKGREAPVPMPPTPAPISHPIAERRR